MENENGKLNGHNHEDGLTDEELQIALDEADDSFEFDPIFPGQEVWIIQASKVTTGKVTKIVTTMELEGENIAGSSRYHVEGHRKSFPDDAVFSNEHEAMVSFFEKNKK